MTLTLKDFCACSLIGLAAASLTLVLVWGVEWYLRRRNRRDKDLWG